MNKKAVAGFELTLMLISIFAFSYMIYLSDSVNAAATMSEPSSCCEKTVDGAFCINANEEQCNENFRSSPTSCESTSYCRLGTCYDSSEGICMENTPQMICDENGGIWDSRPANEVPQCQLGCCIIADQAAFVSLVRCKRLSSLFGVENNYRTDITSELACIATAQSQDVGACVYEQDFERVCKFTTREDCGVPSEVETAGEEIEITNNKKFYKDYLCSAEELNTICARQTSTTCYGGKVYYEDSCGNRENVYSSDKVKSWNNGRVADPSEICSPNDGSDKNCGNCEYLLGSRCAEFEGLIGKPEGSEHYCRTAECVDREGNERMNGESWCVADGRVGEGKDMVGSRYYREICIDGEVVVEPCADYRNELCLSEKTETSLGDFETSACRVNRWQDCILQTEEEDCTNIDRRDCMWVDSVTGMMLGGGEGSTKYSNPADTYTFSNPTATGNVIAPITGKSIFGGGDDEEEQEETVTNRPDGICVPNYPPGFEFWKESSAQNTCNQASAKCVVVYEKGLIGGGWECVEGCECLEEGWAMEANRVCAAIGDCGGYVNYIGKYTDNGYSWKEDGTKKKFAPNTINKISAGFTGMAITSFNPVGIITGNVVRSYLQDWMDSGSLDGSSQISTTIPINPPAGGILPTTEFEGGQSFIAEKMGLPLGGGASAIVSGLQWAGVAYMVGQLAGGMLGMDENNVDALSTALAAGFGIYKGLASWQAMAGNTGFMAAEGSGTIFGAMGWGSVIGIAVFIAMYKKTDIEIVTFDCMPWQAPTGEGECETCNDDTLPCSEYRCKSLGQNCEFVEGDVCVNVNPGDTRPPTISPNYEVLSYGYEYTNVKNSPPGPGFEIERIGNEKCLQAFTPLTFGITTDEPAQCKIDLEYTATFDEMRNYIGGSNIFKYNHTESFSLPGASAFNNSTFVLENGNEFTFYLRCQDKNGNTNEANYAVRFCVEEGPDATAPEIKATSINNNSCVAENSDSAIVDFYVNEPSECRWSTTDQSFENMQNTMSCASEMRQINAMQLFTCRANLTGISRDNTPFYVRCKDQPNAEENDRNVMQQSRTFNLKGSTGLKINKVEPNETIFGGVNPAPVELYVQTLFGCDAGKAICYYSKTGDEDDFITFYDTNNEDGIHTQRQDLPEGGHKYYVRCVDSGGNVAEETIEFKVDIDVGAPVVARVYQESSMLKVVTVRESECAYSFDNCDFTFDEGIEMPYANTTVHVAEWLEDKTYHIKCRDAFRNEDADCSVVVKPSRNLF